MTDTLANAKVAMLIANGFDEIHFTDTQRALLKAEAKVVVVSPENGLANGWHDGAWGHYFPIDKAIGDVLAADYDMLFVPGGPAHIRKLASNPHTRRILTAFLDAGKRTVLVDEAVELLITVERAEGRTVAAGQRLAEQMAKAGAQVNEDHPMVREGAVLTVRTDGTFTSSLEPVLAFLAGQESAAVQQAA